MRHSHTYLDHASTSFPKAPGVWEAMRHFAEEIGVSPQRGGSRRGRAASAVVEETRNRLARLIGAARSDSISFCSGATTALNTVLHGLLRSGDHVVTTSAEHNSVLRPLEALQRRGTVEYSVAPVAADGSLDCETLERFISPRTKLIAVTHASNVTGAVLPVEQISEIARRRRVPLLVDCSQTVGSLSIDVEAWGASFVAFAAHKSLLGPSGMGALFVRDPDCLEPLCEGGTGNLSHSLLHPSRAPEKFEAGTINYLGVAGLLAALQHHEKCADARRAHLALATRFCEGVAKLDRVRIHGPAINERRLPVVSFTLERATPAEVSQWLDEEYGIITRPGLQCAPLMHQALQTFPHGTVRASFGYGNTVDDVERLVEAVTRSVA